ncbi:hypothetical protein Psfp_02318 [Pelotomaculum sp. FP]|uniref:hypothetical protein n=1 Tax=Pelotomaculum sp. FP TaxID=261474 RepID=UPI0010649CFA|nr:hypothetical protein [Pelotomaculum sp. FP]TEB15142.1 hypothetical protein Psfp_02318 [Pelotomaculum sp. FP]
MSEERLKHIEEMVEQLIRISGNTVAAIEELRNGQEELRNGQNELRGGQEELGKELTDLKKEVLQRLDNLEYNIEYLANKVTKHDMQIYRIKQKIIG